MDRVPGGGHEVVQVRLSKLPKIGRRGEQPQSPQACADLIASVPAADEQPALNEIRCQPVDRGKRQTAPPGQLGEAETPVLGVECA